MGYDYHCPQCGGPAYGEDRERWCEACRNGLPTSYTCHWCKCFVYSTTRCGGERCQNRRRCENMICSDCRMKHHWKGPEFIEKKYCMRCYEECLSPEQIDAIYAEQINRLEKELQSLKSRREKLVAAGSSAAATISHNSIDQACEDSDCKQQ